MNTYRVGGSWKTHTIVLEGSEPADEKGKRPDDLAVAWIDSAAPEGLAARIAWLLTHTCPTCMGPERETVDMVCQTCGTDYTRRIGPCSVNLPSLILGQSDHLCELLHGHTGDHVAGPTRWNISAEVLADARMSA